MNITVTGTGHVVAQTIRNKGMRAKGAWMTAAREMGDAWLQECKRLSERQHASTAQLRKRGHPYAQRQFMAKGKAARGGLPAPSYVINRQTGRLFGGWQAKIQQIGGSIYTWITNTAPYFIYLHFGTKKMIRRPILSQALANVRPKFEQIKYNAQRRIHGM